jgi:ribonuclease VapC
VIVDSSAIIAIIKNEPEAQRFSEVLEAEDYPKVSVVNYVEAGVVADATKDPRIPRQFDNIIRTMEIEVVAVNFQQARLARDAYRDFGKGSGQAAKR